MSTWRENRKTADVRASLWPKLSGLCSSFCAKVFNGASCLPVLFAPPGRPCASDWREVALLPRVHAVLLRMVRSGPEAAAKAIDVVVDSCRVRAKHGGDLTGPNPTDRGKRGTKYHVVVSTEGWPLGAVASAANVNDTEMFPELLRLALVAGAAISRLLAPLWRLRRSRCRGKGCWLRQRR